MLVYCLLRPYYWSVGVGVEPATNTTPLAATLIQHFFHSTIQVAAILPSYIHSQRYQLCGPLTVCISFKWYPWYIANGTLQHQPKEDIATPGTSLAPCLPMKSPLGSAKLKKNYGIFSYRFLEYKNFNNYNIVDQYICVEFVLFGFFLAFFCHSMVFFGCLSQSWVLFKSIISA